ncbi:hypothetical protein EB817_05625 [Streptococcus pyogenes]|nr:hypothetical protein EB817_05625 [Streptococcus pyogenes]
MQLTKSKRRSKDQTKSSLLFLFSGEEWSLFSFLSSFLVLRECKKNNGKSLKFSFAGGVKNARNVIK